MSDKKKVDAYDVFQSVDEVVCKPITGSVQALQWQTFRTGGGGNRLSHSSVAPRAPLTKVQRAAGFSSWKDEQEHEEELRKQRNEASLHQGYKTFQEKHSATSALTSKQIQRIQKRIRPDDQEYFIASETFAEFKFDYVFTTRDRGTGYYWDGTDSLRRLMESPPKGDMTTTNGSRFDAKSAVPQVAEESPQQEGVAGEKLRKKKVKRETTERADADHSATVFATSQNPMEQVAALWQSQIQQRATLPTGWELALDSTSKQTYYYNRLTGERSWERPKLEIADENGSFRTERQEWYEATDTKTGKVYFYNAAGETRWEDPR